MGKEKPIIHKKKYVILFILFLIGILFLLYSRFVSTSGLIIKEHKIVNSSLPENFHGFKIVHLSDIHYGRIIQKEELKNIVEKINLLKPDLVVITGDLLDSTTDIDEKELIEGLSKIKANIYKVAIKGNHDMAHRTYKKIIEESGFKDMDDTYELIYKEGYQPILLAGLSTNTVGTSDINKKMEKTMNYLKLFKGNDQTKSEEEIKALKEKEPKYKILLLHEPDFIDEIESQEFDLILAGHSHNGQVRLPFIGALYTPEGSKKYYDEYYDLGKSKLYISSGLGTSTINFRFFNRPSFNFYRLTTK